MHEQTLATKRDLGARHDRHVTGRHDFPGAVNLAGKQAARSTIEADPAIPHKSIGLEVVPILMSARAQVAGLILHRASLAAHQADPPVSPLTAPRPRDRHWKPQASATP